jgi:hypothetical protein
VGNIAELWWFNPSLDTCDRLIMQGHALQSEAKDTHDHLPEARSTSALLNPRLRRRRGASRDSYTASIDVEHKMQNIRGLHRVTDDSKERQLGSTSGW